MVPKREVDTLHDSQVSASADDAVAVARKEEHVCC